jgi:hypothetical protein
MDYFLDGNRYTESDWRQDCDARETAELKWEAQQMEDYTIESTPRETQGQLRRAIPKPPLRSCCDVPENFVCHPSIERDLHTGYFEGDYFECQECGSRICEEDFQSLCSWVEGKLTPIGARVAELAEPRHDDGKKVA